MTRLAIALLTLSLIAAPLAAEAQQAGKVPHIGWLSPGTRQPAPASDGFIRGLRDHGYVEGENIVIERRYAEWRPDRLPAAAAELAALNVNVIAVVGPAGIRAAQQATRTIPVVMMASSSDPVAEGLVASLSRPGGNITGVTAGVSLDIVGKQLELLRESLGSVPRIAVLWDVVATPFQRDWNRSLHEAAGRLGSKIESIEALTPADFESAMQVAVAKKASAVYVAMGGATYPYRGRVAELAVRHGLPTIGVFRELPEAGGLMSYGPNVFELYRRAAWYVHRILQGAQPGDLPVEQPTKFELIINMKTAKALRLTIPQSVLLRADEVIQ